MCSLFFYFTVLLLFKCQRFFESDAMLFYFFVTRNVYLYEEEYIDIHRVKIAVSKYINVESEKFETNAMLK